MNMTQKKMVEAEITIQDLEKVPPNEAIANNVVSVLRVVQVEVRMLQCGCCLAELGLSFGLRGRVPS
jgi:hypothetical protein